MRLVRRLPFVTGTPLLVCAFTKRFLRAKLALNAIMYAFVETGHHAPLLHLLHCAGASRVEEGLGKGTILVDQGGVVSSEGDTVAKREKKKKREEQEQVGGHDSSISFGDREHWTALFLQKALWKVLRNQGERKKVCTGKNSHTYM